MATATLSRLVDEEVAQLFTVPASDWRAINRQALAVAKVPESQQGLSPDDVLAAVPIAVFLNQVPAFPPLRTLFGHWRASTYPAILAHAGMVEAYAQQSIADFSAMQPALAAAMLRDLHQRTTAISAQFTPLAVEIDELRQANASMESYLAEHPDIADIWQTIAPQIAVSSDIAGKIAHVEGTWRALADDLGALAPADDLVTLPFLIALEVDTAIASWTRIQTEATAFLTRQAPAP